MLRTHLGERSRGLWGLLHVSVQLVDLSVAETIQILIEFRESPAYLILSSYFLLQC